MAKTTINCVWDRLKLALDVAPELAILENNEGNSSNCIEINLCSVCCYCFVLNINYLFVHKSVPI